MSQVAHSNQCSITAWCFEVLHILTGGEAMLSALGRGHIEAKIMRKGIGIVNGVKGRERELSTETGGSLIQNNPWCGHWVVW